jgi:hypothetical protein
MKLHEYTKYVLNRCIFISGPARSGTTIVGKIIGSCENIEYSFEPPMLLAILANSNSMDDDLLQYLLEAYLVEDVFASLVSGRGYNTNYQDYSSIISMKTIEFIEKKRKISLRKEEVVSMFGEQILSFKSPSMSLYIKRFKELFADSQVIITHRHPADVIRSILEKGWFSSRSDISWPFKSCESNRTVPFFVEEEFCEEWNKISEIDKCAYYYLRITEARETFDHILVDYQKLTENPKKIISNLMETIGLAEGSKTQDLIKSIKYGRNSLGNGLLRNVSSNFSRIHDYY